MPDITLFKYDKPDLAGRKKSVQILSRTDVAMVAAQVVSEGGENKLHSHTYMDGFWLVIAGRARFYTTDDVLVADLGPMEGVLIPRGYPYWFERSGDTDLELLQFEASSKRLGDDLTRDMVDHTTQRMSSEADV
jgi:mannose-6-phosphate isomerase-like protein (cupin superfamily)